ncbi:MAG: Rrf2 family transcriptional regulator [Lachnospiraceae bacterium]|nr:Rrf2 family transcriptional regulator [Lachnospiraceae bacterium]
MFITREMDYCIRIVRALHHGGMLSATEIAAKENMPQAITYKLLKQLLKSDIVKSFRGAEGGYKLNINCNSVTIMDLFRKMGIEVAINKCLTPGYMCENIDCNVCKVHQELNRIQTVLIEELGRKPLASIL